MKSKKGQYGYFDSEKKRRILFAVIALAVPLTVILTSWAYFGTRNNLFTVIGAVLMIPFAMSIVSLIMFLMRKSIPQAEYDTIRPHEGDLTCAYELYMTTEKKNYLVDCLVICGNEVVGLMTEPNARLRECEQHVTKMLRADGYRCNVHMMDSIPKFTRRMDELNAHAAELRAGLKFTPNPAYEGFGREDMIMHTCLSISL